MNETNLIDGRHQVDWSKMRMERNENYKPQIMALQKDVAELKAIIETLLSPKAEIKTKTVKKPNNGK